MTYVITQPCVGVCDTACVSVCPMDCIHGPLSLDQHGKEGETLSDLSGQQLYIDPDECICCGACEPECPVSAIYAEEDVPSQWDSFVQKNRAFFGE